MRVSYKIIFYKRKRTKNKTEKGKQKKRKKFITYDNPYLFKNFSCQLIIYPFPFIFLFLKKKEGEEG